MVADRLGLVAPVAEVAAAVVAVFLRQPGFLHALAQQRQLLRRAQRIPILPGLPGERPRCVLHILRALAEVVAHPVGDRRDAGRAGVRIKLCPDAMRAQVLRQPGLIDRAELMHAAGEPVEVHAADMPVPRQHGVQQDRMRVQLRIGVAHGHRLELGIGLALLIRPGDFGCRAAGEVHHRKPRGFARLDPVAIAAAAGVAEHVGRVGHRELGRVAVRVLDQRALGFCPGQGPGGGDGFVGRPDHFHIRRRHFRRRQLPVHVGRTGADARGHPARP